MIYLMLLLALFLRLVNLNQSLWWDEAINVVYARSSDFWWFMTKYPVNDFHPPGWFAILWTWGHIFGFSEVSVRLPSVILATATVWLVFLLGKDLFNKRTGLLAALFTAIAPLHIYYSQEARMYVFAAFSVTLSFYFLHRLTIKKKWAGLGLVISLILVLYSDYLAYLVIPAQIMYLVWAKKVRKDFLVILFATGLTLLPWLNVFPSQLKMGLNTAYALPGWGQVVGSSFKDLLLIPVKTFFGRVSFSDKTFYAIISCLAGLLFGSIFFYGFKKIDQATKLLICWIFIPLILAFLISFFIPVLSYFRMIFILPACYLILGKGVDSLSKKISIPAIILICLISLASLFGYYLNPSFQREDWRGAINFLSQRLNNQTLVVFEYDEIPAPVRYYSSDLSNFRSGLSEDLKNDLIRKNRVFLFEYLAGVYDPKRVVAQKLESQGFNKIKVYNFPGVGFVTAYEK